MGDVRQHPIGSKDFFNALERLRYKNDDFMPGQIQFGRYRGRTVLEVGCGLGTDLVQFARVGANTYGLDLSGRSVELAARRLKEEGCRGCLLQADAERLPFKDNAFDLVYSWGVLHHTPDTAGAIREMIRVCKPEGELLVMLYHLRSLVTLQVWLRYGLLRGNPWASPRRLIADHMESPGTKAYTREEACDLFDGMHEVATRSIVTCYDARIGRRLFLPRAIRRLIPSGLGWFLLIRAKGKPR